MIDQRGAIGLVISYSSFSNKPISYVVKCLRNRCRYIHVRRLTHLTQFFSFLWKVTNASSILCSTFVFHPKICGDVIPLSTKTVRKYSRSQKNSFQPKVSPVNCLSSSVSTKSCTFLYFNQYFDILRWLTTTR